MAKNRSGQPGVWAALAAALFLAGCSSAHYRKSADLEAYKAIREKTAAVPNMDPRFTIERTNQVSLEGLPILQEPGSFLGEHGEAERGARIIPLEKALEIGITRSRSYQSSKEQLFLSALSLTLSRHTFTPLFSGSGRGRYNVQTEQELALVPDPANPGQAKPVLSDQLVERNSVSGGGSVGVDWLVRDIGRLSTAFTTDFLRFLSGSPGTVASSQVGASFTRPLLRNAGFKRDIENLTQSERNLLYALRNFTRFRKSFTVQIASAYYDVLGNRDAARNSHLRLLAARRSAEQGRALAQEGRVPQGDLGRLEQSELTAESGWIAAVRSYRQALDNFKLQLGMPVDTRLVLDDQDLAQLTIRHPQVDVEAAFQIAKQARLDYLNARAQFEDSERQLKLAVDGLKPQVDLAGSATFRSREQDKGFPLPEMDRYSWNAGLNVDLGLDKKGARNSYRAALIARDQAQRAVEQLEDEIRIQVRDGWRSLEQARRSYEISDLGVKLSERRVEMQTLLAELGRAKAQDQVDAENDLASSRNQRTQALVGHTISRLQFWNNLGILYIKDNGQWEEITDAKAP
jgi:outer membrane protein TolC